MNNSNTHQERAKTTEVHYGKTYKPGQFIPKVLDFGMFNPVSGLTKAVEKRHQAKYRARQDTGYIVAHQRRDGVFQRVVIQKVSK